MTTAPKLTPTEKAAKALSKLSDAEWLQVKSDEDRRRADQHTIRDLAKRYRELRKIDPEPGAMTGPTITTAGATGNAR